MLDSYYYGLPTWCALAYDHAGAVAFIGFVLMLYYVITSRIVD